MNEKKQSWLPAALRLLPRLLYNHNPFYPVSAALTLYGIHRTVENNVSLAGGMLTAELLCGYTALLAVVAYLIARFGRVWDDARTILLIVALLLVALSTAFDPFALAEPEQGAILLGLGALFTVLVTEGLLRSLQMRLPARYRVSYYLLMGLLFLYPYVLAKLSKSGPESAMPWAMLLFPVSAAGALLTLWPAARFDDRHEGSNGTPWKWPLYPWSLFTILIVAVGLRSYSLGMTFEAGRGLASSFSSWFLIPLALAAAILLLELGLTAQNRTARTIALAMPLGCLPLVLCGASCPQSEHFRQVLTEATGSPPQLALAAMTVFYLVIWWRGIRIGEWALVCCLALAATVDRNLSSGHATGQWHLTPLLLIAAIEFVVGARRRSSFRIMVSLTALGVAAATIERLSAVLGTPEQYLWQLNPLVALAAAAAFNDKFAKMVRAVVWPWLTIIATWVAADSLVRSSPLSESQVAVIVCFAIFGTAYWYRDRSWQRLAGATISLSALSAYAAKWYAPSVEDSALGPGLPWLEWGTAALWAAILVSLAKSGALWRLSRAFQQFGDGRTSIGIENSD
jgi:hypothetical protein